MINTRKFFSEKTSGNLSDGAVNIFYIAMNNSKNANGQYSFFLTDDLDITQTHNIYDSEIDELINKKIISASNKTWLYNNQGLKIGVKIIFV
jgi:hypothetical protein